MAAAPHGVAATPHPSSLRASEPDKLRVLKRFGEMCAEALNLILCTFDHRFEIGDECFVYRVICGAERIERGSARSVENPKHCEFLCRVRFDGLRLPRNIAALTLDLRPSRTRRLSGCRIRSS